MGLLMTQGTFALVIPPFSERCRTPRVRTLAGRKKWSCHLYRRSMCRNIKQAPSVHETQKTTLRGVNGCVSFPPTHYPTSVPVRNNIYRSRVFIELVEEPKVSGGDE